MLCASGIVLGTLLFLLSAHYPNRMYLGPICRRNTTEAGFDAWTGLPHTSTYVCEPAFDGDPPAHLVADPMPDDLVNRRAIPLPVGFVVGVGVAGLVMAARRRSQQPNIPGD